VILNNGKEEEPISPVGPDASRCGLTVGCEMTLVRDGKSRRYQVRNSKGDNPFPKHWNRFELFALEDCLVGAGELDIDGVPYAIDIVRVHTPSQQPDLLECRYTCLAPTKAHNGVWHAPLRI